MWIVCLDGQYLGDRQGIFVEDPKDALLFDTATDAVTFFAFYLTDTGVSPESSVEVHHLGH